MVELRAQPTKPWAASGLCRKRTSRGMSPSCSGRVCTISWRCQSHTCMWLPYSPGAGTGPENGLRIRAADGGQKLGHSPGQNAEKPVGGIRKTLRHVRGPGTILYHHPRSRFTGGSKRLGEGFQAERSDACAQAPAGPRGALTGFYVSGVEAISKDIGSRPFSADHDIVSRLVPEVIAQRCSSPRLFPRPLHLERLSIQQHETP